MALDTNLYPFPGVRGSGSWTDTDMRPKNWREMILRLYPNGRAPLTAVLSKMKSESTDDPEYYWWSKELPEQTQALLTDGGTTPTYHKIETDATGAPSGTAYDPGSHAHTAGTVLHLCVSTDALYTAAEKGRILNQFRAGHIVTLMDTADMDNLIQCEVASTPHTARSTFDYIQIKLLDNDGAGDGDPREDGDNATHVMISGNWNEENADTPGGVVYDPWKAYNYTQIFRTSLAMSRTARRTRLRTGDAIAEAKRDALELHAIEMEKAFIFGRAYETTGPASLPKRTTGGILSFLSTNLDDYRVNEDYDATTWASGGDAWMDEQMEILFRYGSNEKVAYCGSGAMLGLNQLAKAKGTWEMTAMKSSYGIEVVRWVTPFGSILLKTHPLFTINPVLRNSMLILDTKHLVYRYLRGDDTKYLEKRQGNGVDGTKSEYLTECGLEVHFEKAHGFYAGVGQDNPA